MASYASLMVSVDLDPVATDRIRLAGALAGRFGARLIGVAAAPAYVLLYGGMSPTAHARLVEDERRRVGEALDEAQALFERTVQSRAATEWRPAVEVPVDHLLGQARAADLVVVGRHGPADTLDQRFGVLPGRILMELGRPVLLVPPWVDRLFASRIVVAWKETREARRAVWDALPFLQTAEQVFIVVVGEEDQENQGREGAADVAAYLTRHGAASATVLRRELELSVARTLQRTAEREGADLIVAGAYGHSRLREWVFGGVTRDLLDDTAVCCLMSR